MGRGNGFAGRVMALLLAAMLLLWAGLAQAEGVSRAMVAILNDVEAQRAYYVDDDRTQRWITARGLLRLVEVLGEDWSLEDRAFWAEQMTEYGYFSPRVPYISAVPSAEHMPQAQAVALARNTLVEGGLPAPLINLDMARTAFIQPRLWRYDNPHWYVSFGVTVGDATRTIGVFVDAVEDRVLYDTVVEKDIAGMLCWLQTAPYGSMTVATADAPWVQTWNRGHYVAGQKVMINPFDQAAWRVDMDRFHPNDGKYKHASPLHDTEGMLSAIEVVALASAAFLEEGLIPEDILSAFQIEVYLLQTHSGNMTYWQVTYVPGVYSLAEIIDCRGCVIQIDPYTGEPLALSLKDWQW